LEHVTVAGRAGDEKNPGVCIQKNDFEQMLDVYKRADFRR